jgi:hypothetical protein
MPRDVWRDRRRRRAAPAAAVVTVEGHSAAEAPPPGPSASPAQPAPGAASGLCGQPPPATGWSPSDELLDALAELLRADGQAADGGPVRRERPETDRSAGPAEARGQAGAGKRRTKRRPNSAEGPALPPKG